VSDSPAPFAQTKYQVRFDQGAAGAARIGAGVDVLVWVDVLDGAGPVQGRAALRVPQEALDAVPVAAAVLLAGLTDARAVAAALLAEQERLGRRAALAIVAAGRVDGGFAADDVLAAGAVIDALAELGIDDTSPEAAVACAAYTGLRRAVVHLTTASVAGREAVAAGADPVAVRAAAVSGGDAAARIVRAGGAPTASA
jgi:2-phosphosulfolactate phosphatase